MNLSILKKRSGCDRFVCLRKGNIEKAWAKSTDSKEKVTMNDGAFLVSNKPWVALQNFSNLRNYPSANQNGNGAPDLIALLNPQYSKKLEHTLQNDEAQASIRLIRKETFHLEALLSNMNVLHPQLPASAYKADHVTLFLRRTKTKPNHQAYSTSHLARVGKYQRVVSKTLSYCSKKHCYDHMMAEAGEENDVLAVFVKSGYMAKWFSKAFIIHSTRPEQYEIRGHFEN